VDERDKRRNECWKRGKGRIVRTVSMGVTIAVRIMRVRRDGWRMTARAREMVDPPDMPEATRAPYFHRPDGNVVTKADSSHTGIKALGDRGAGEERLGIIKERNVDRWTPTTYPAARPPIPPSNNHCNFLVRGKKSPGRE